MLGFGATYCYDNVQKLPNESAIVYLNNIKTGKTGIFPLGDLLHGIDQPREDRE
jgi:hypothetical protein